jgi:hypothetical protein
MAKKTRCARCGEECASERWARDHCKPSRIALRTGYRTDSKRHRAARYKLPAKRRQEIASLGGAAFAQAARRKALKTR